jgi:hypothetical protein
MNTTYNINSLSKEDIASILEALLFSSSTDVCATWYKEESLKSFEVAKKIRLMFPEIILENVYMYNDEILNNEYHDAHSEDILKFFPEIKKNLKEEIIP